MIIRVFTTLKLFLEWRWHVSQATSPAFADALFAVIIAGSITIVLQFLFD